MEDRPGGDPEGRIVAGFIELSGVTKTYGSGPQAVRALDGVTFDADHGEWIAIMGPSGSGKTTLLNLIGCLDQATSGSVRIGGVDCSKLRRSELAKFRSETVGFVFQQFHLVPHLTALENVMLAQFFHSMTDETEALASLKHEQGRTIVMVTHDENAGRLADRRLNLEYGRIKENLVFSAEQNQDFDEVLEHLWMRDETRGHMESTAFTEAQWRRLIATMAQIGLVAVKDGVERFTPVGEERARDVIRRHRLAERLFMDVLSIRDEVEIESSACKFEHILSPEVTDRMCTLMGHPTECPHGSPIPRGECCAEGRVLDSEDVASVMRASMAGRPGRIA
jgi:ABC-type lipoprotein export system ATPase subunit/Mn-dependent DtxR family transcriptional regulator